MSKVLLSERSMESADLFSKIKAVESILRIVIEELHQPIRQERYLTGIETCRFLHISQRTLQTLRDNRQISYTVVGDRTFLYPESELNAMLKRNYRSENNR